MMTWQEWEPNRPDRPVSFVAEPHPHPVQIRRSFVIAVAMSVTIFALPLVADGLDRIGARWLLAPVGVAAIGWAMIEGRKL